MPRTLNGGIQTDKSDRRKYITYPVIDATTGATAYRKVYLRTKDHKVATRRAAVLSNVNDPETARRIVAYVAAARTPEQESARLAEFSDIKPLQQSMSLDAARADLADLTGETDLTADIVNRFRIADKAQQSEILQALGVPADVIANNPELLSDRKLSINPNFTPKHIPIAMAFNISEEKAREIVRDTPARGPKLSACLIEFDIVQDQKNTTANHRNHYKNRFNEFVELIGDKSIKSLTKQDFVAFRDKVLKDKKGKSGKTINDTFKPIEAVLKIARTRMPDGIFPNGLSDWFGVFSKVAYKPKATNRAPMPVDIFKALLNNAETWIKDPETMRDGMLVHACLCVAANCGATSIDLSRLKWSDLSLDSELPLYMQSRTKTETNEDIIIPVKCPLLPETVASLKRWKQWQDKNQKSEFVFTTVTGLACRDDDSTNVVDLFAEIRKVTKDINGWEARHLRNIGETLRRNSNLPVDMGTAWLRHSEKGTNVFYRGDAKDDYLMPLINIIGETYFKLVSE